MDASVITIGIDPEFELGPLMLTWHGLMTAVGIVVGALVARAYARRRGLEPDEITGLVLVLAIAGIIGSRAFFLLENDAAALLQPGEWLESRGFSFYGAILLGVPAAALYMRRRGLRMPYLDALAFGFPAGLAVGRIGDVINGEHFGPASELPWAVRYTHPQAEVPSADVAYHSGGVYEVALALVILAVVWPLRDRVLPPGTLLWLVIGLYAVGRFAMFFVREDSETLVAGLNGAQWTSLLLIAVAAVGLWRARASGASSGSHGHPGPAPTAQAEAGRTGSRT